MLPTIVCFKDGNRLELLIHSPPLVLCFMLADMELEGLWVVSFSVCGSFVYTMYCSVCMCCVLSVRVSMFEYCVGLVVFYVFCARIISSEWF